MHSKTMYLHTALFLLLLASTTSFIVNPSIAITTLQKQKVSSSSSSSRNLHVDPIHIHRDSLLRLDDPMLLGKETQNHPKPYHWDTKQIHKFTNSFLAPLVLALYLVGYYLSQHHHELIVNHVGENGDDSNMMTHLAVDPMFGGGMLIGVGLYMMKWSVDRTFLSPP